MEKDPNELLSPPTTAAMLGTTVGTLEVWRCTKRYNLPYVKIGSNVRYMRKDVEAFIASRRVAVGTPAPAPAADAASTAAGNRKRKAKRAAAAELL